MPIEKNKSYKPTKKPQMMVVGNNTKTLALYTKIFKNIPISLHLFENTVNAKKFYRTNYKDIDITLIDAVPSSKKWVNLAKEIVKINPNEKIILIQKSTATEAPITSIENIEYVINKNQLQQNHSNQKKLLNFYVKKILSSKKHDKIIIKKDQKSMQKLNELEAQNLALHSAEQSLKNENKQLKLEQQHLKAMNLQLIATNQQLKKNEDTLRKITKEFKEQITTLETLNIIYNLAQDTENPLKNIFHELARLAPSVWDYPNIRKQLVQSITDQLNALAARAEAQEKLKDSERQYRLLAENITDIIITTDLNLYFTYISPSIKNILGYSSKEIKNLSFNQILTPSSLEIFMKTVDSILNSNKDAEDKNTKSKTIECEICSKDGKAIWNELQISPIYDDYNLPIGFLVVSRDITARKQAEKELKFYNSLLRHDVNNKNQISIGFLQLLLEAGLSDEQHGFVEKALQATRASSELIQKLRDLERVKSERVVEGVSVDAVVGRIVKQFSPVAGEKGIEVVFRPSGMVVSANSLLEDVFSNLVQNAIDHSGCRRIVVSSVREGDLCRVSVEDDGRGLPEEVRGHVFDKWVKGKESEGTGIGLHLVRSIVEGYGGRVEVRDRGGRKGGVRGTVFDVYIPVVGEGGV